jgi:hypothetical protein
VQLGLEFRELATNDLRCQREILAEYVLKRERLKGRRVPTLRAPPAA